MFRALVVLAILALARGQSGFRIDWKSTQLDRNCVAPGTTLWTKVDVTNTKTGNPDAPGQQLAVGVTNSATADAPAGALSAQSNTCPSSTTLGPGQSLKCEINYVFPVQTPEQVTNRVDVRTSTSLDSASIALNNDYWIIPSITANAPNPQCFGDVPQLTFKVNGAATYTDFDGNLRQRYAFTVKNGETTIPNGSGTTDTRTDVNLPLPTGSATYTISVTSADGGACTATTTVSIVEPPQLTIKAEGDCDAENKERITVTAAGGTLESGLSYIYKLNGVEQASNVFAPNGPGTYTVSVEDSNGCTATTTVTVRCVQPHCALTHGYWKNLGNAYVALFPEGTWCGASYQTWLTTTGNTLNQNAGRQYVSFVLTMYWYAPTEDIRDLSVSGIVALGVPQEVAQAAWDLSQPDACGRTDKSWYNARASILAAFNGHDDDVYVENIECNPKLPRTPTLRAIVKQVKK